MCGGEGGVDRLFLKQNENDSHFLSNGKIESYIAKAVVLGYALT
jgi:hypothetical protein